MKNAWGDEIEGAPAVVNDWGDPVEQAEPAPQGSGGPLQGLKDLLGFAGKQVERVSSGPLRGAEQGIQDYEPEGGGFHPGVIAAALKGAGRGFMDPDQVQPSQQAFSRMGVSDAPSSRLNVMGTSGRPISLGQDRPAGDPSLAATLGTAQDMLSPVPPVLSGLRGAGKVIQKTGKLAEKTAISAAEKAILENYNPTLMKEFAPIDGGAGTIANAPRIVAEKLKEHDLLYNPSKAQFNLKRDIRKTGEQIGEVVKQGKERDLSVNVQKEFDGFLARREAAIEQNGKGSAAADAFRKDAAPRIQAIINELRPNELGEVPLDKAVNLKRELQDLVKNWGDQAGKPVIQGAAQELQSALNKAIEATDPRIGPKLAGLNNKYSDLMDLSPLIEDAYARGFGKAAAGKKAASLKDRIVESFIGENGKPMVKSLVKAAASPAKTVAQWLPENAMEGLANRGRRAYPDMYASEPIVRVPEILKREAAAAPGGENAIPDIPMRPNTASQRRPLTPPPAPKEPAKEGLPPRQSSYVYPQRRPLAPIAQDPSLSVEILGKVMDADAAKDIAKTQYQADRLKVLWKKVQESKSPKQRSALMNLIRGVHKSTPRK
jgi:hypothetical protein